MKNSINQISIVPTEQDKRKIISAIKNCKHKVTVSQAVEKTSLPAATAEICLRNLAYETSARILVDNTGNLAYQFKHGFQRQLKIPLENILPLLGKILQQTICLLLKSIFGIALILSFAPLFIPACLIAIAKFAYDFVNLRDKADERLGIFDLRNWSGFLGGIFCTEISHSDKILPSNIFLDCYSFVFGDGDPNLDLDERKWQGITSLIARNDGVLVCEQLAPYIMHRSSEEDMLPVLVRFDGYPTVTESGFLAYVFPFSNNKSAPENLAVKIDLKEKPDYLLERYWRFSGISAKSMAWIGALAILNGLFVLTVILFALAQTAGQSFVAIPAMYFCLVLSGTIWHFVISLVHIIGIWGSIITVLALIVALPCSLVLSFFFLVYPLFRIVLNQLRNIVIRQRNEERKSLALKFLRPSPKLDQKLKESRQCAPINTAFGSNKIIFDTSQKLLDQNFNC